MGQGEASECEVGVSQKYQGCLALVTVLVPGTLATVLMLWGKRMSSNVERLIASAVEDEERRRMLLQDPEVLAADLHVQLTDVEMEVLHAMTEERLMQMIQALTDRELELDEPDAKRRKLHFTGHTVG